MKTNTKKRKIFSIKYKLSIIFACLMLIIVAFLTVISVKTARDAVSKRVDIQLKTKAHDAAELIETGLETEINYLETVARLVLQDTKSNYFEKAKILETEAKAQNLTGLYMADLDGNLYLPNGKILSVEGRDFFIAARAGKSFVLSPYIDRITGKLVLSITAPVYDKNERIIGMIGGDFDALKLNDLIKDIVVGDTGYCYIVDLDGSTIAHKNRERVMARENLIEMAKTDETHKSNAEFIEKAINSVDSTIEFYEHNGYKNVATFAKIPMTGWTAIVKAPTHEFLGDIERLKFELITTSTILDLIALIIIFVIVNSLMNSLTKISNALKNIAEGDGDLTVRLPVRGNDEVSEISNCFNQTIKKIDVAMQSVMQSTDRMDDLGQTLSSNMNQTASSINEISANIDGVKGQVFTQSASVTETSATMEEIIQTIHNLDLRIAKQVENLQNLIKIIEDSNKTTGETRNILTNNDRLIAELVNDSSKGKEVISESGEEVKRILEESGSLMEASSIIQNIASQTNLLAMNAAIEAAHAGDAGKGFAVVADEIRKLAEESSSQAQSITKTLKTLSSEIGSVSESSTHIEETFSSIFAKVNQVKDRSAEIMRIAQTRQEQSDKLLNLVESVDGVTNEVKDGSAEMLKGGEIIAKDMRTLSELTRVISDSMNEMATGASQINNSVQEVNELTQENKENIKKLATEVNKFRV